MRQIKVWLIASLGGLQAAPTELITKNKVHAAGVSDLQQDSVL